MRVTVFSWIKYLLLVVIAFSLKPHFLSGWVYQFKYLLFISCCLAVFASCLSPTSALDEISFSYQEIDFLASLSEIIESNLGVE